MEFIYSKNFKKQFGKLNYKTQESFQERIKIFVKNPNHIVLNNHKLSGKYHDYRSINITGDYRVVFKIISDDVCYLVAIGTHSKLY
ncbi:type II toxin-antitoxin system mRNA interferase toxin, RelE/StbE family [Candidatus Parcubacteria bacterium]|nr:type II toxin-antitoxin system mRNA interferase toxin, RelE/StbE family [Candidatus Parcubacteria bacterium]